MNELRSGSATRHWRATSLTRCSAEQALVHRTIGLETMLEIERQPVEKQA